MKKMTNKDPDFLDELIEEEVKRDPEFATLWEGAKKRLALAQLRKDAGLSQRDVAKVMGVKQPRIAEIESRPEKVAFGTMEQYAAAIGATFVLTPIKKAKKARKPA